MNLLLVDDEDSTREGIRNYIPWEWLGVHAVETARNGIDALEVAARFLPDILLTDVRMPKMDGVELAGRIRGQFPRCKIIFLSGYSDKEYLMSAIKLNAVRYVEKPIILEEITEAISESVHLSRADKERSSMLKHNLAYLLATESGTVSTAELEAAYGEFMMTGACSFCSLAVQVQAREQQPDTWRMKMIEAIDRYRFEGLSIIAGYTEPHMLAIHLSAAEELKAEKLSALSTSLATTLRSIVETGVSLWIGVGVPVTHSGKLTDSYRAAATAILDEKCSYGSIITQTMNYIQCHFHNKDLTIKQIADELHFSLYYLCSVFKKKTGKTINEYMTEIRINRAIELLKDNRIKIYEIATMVGYSDVRHFTKVIKQVKGLNPSEIREKYLL